MRPGPLTPRATRRITSAHLLSGLALFLALAASGEAVSRITGRDIVNGTLSGADLRAHSVTGREIRLRSLSASAFAPGQLPQQSAELWMHVTGSGVRDAGPSGPGSVDGLVHLAVGQYCVRVSISSSDVSTPARMALVTPDEPNRIIAATRAGSSDCAGILVSEHKLDGQPADGGFTIAAR